MPQVKLRIWQHKIRCVAVVGQRRRLPNNIRNSSRWGYSGWREVYYPADCELWVWQQISLVNYGPRYKRMKHACEIGYCTEKERFGAQHSRSMACCRHGDSLPSIRCCLVVWLGCSKFLLYILNSGKEIVLSFLCSALLTHWVFGSILCGACMTSSLLLRASGVSHQSTVVSPFVANEIYFQSCTLTGWALMLYVFDGRPVGVRFTMICC